MRDLFEELMTELLDRGIMMVTAESCTGGMIASGITDLPGSSQVFERGFVTYSNESKEELLGVQHEILTKYGSVSAETAHSMVQGAIINSRADLGLAVTGIAGPTGGSVEKPVGLVYIACGLRHGGVKIEECHFHGTRDEIRKQSVEKALGLALAVLEGDI